MNKIRWSCGVVAFALFGCAVTVDDGEQIQESSVNGKNSDYFAIVIGTPLTAEQQADIVAYLKLLD